MSWHIGRYFWWSRVRYGKVMSTSWAIIYFLLILLQVWILDDFRALRRLEWVWDSDRICCMSGFWTISAQYTNCSWRGVSRLFLWFCWISGSWTISGQYTHWGLGSVRWGLYLDLLHVLILDHLPPGSTSAHWRWRSEARGLWRYTWKVEMLVLWDWLETSMSILIRKGSRS